MIARNCAVVLVLLCGAWRTALAHEPVSTELKIDTPHAEVGATLAVPESKGKLPCVVIVGGTLSQDRDGRMFRTGIAKRDALKRLAEVLAAGGYASLRYDKVGFGASKAKAGWDNSYLADSQIVASLVAHVRKQDSFDRVIVLGESAGGYVACLSAKNGLKADAFVFLGAHCGSGADIYAYNFERLVKYVERYSENKAWADKLPYEMAMGKQYREMFAAAERGDATFELVDGTFRVTQHLARRREELQWPPDAMFAHIKVPTLAMSGEQDRNVPSDHSTKIVERLKTAGNAKASAIVVSQSDHSFQQVAATEVEQVRERFTLESFRRPYQVAAYRELIKWLRETVPSSVEPDLDDLVEIAQRVEQPAQSSVVRAKDRVEIDLLTDVTPVRIHLAPGIEIIDDVGSVENTAGVDTLEGRIGPLLLGDDQQAHFIDMPPGMFVAEHPHSSESLIYTVRGSWVLCSNGRRHLMKPGSLFRFAAGKPTGYEVPFDEKALLLIFKGSRLTKHEKEFIDYLKGMAERLKKEQKEGIPYLLKDLPADHPARVFAREVNPKFLADQSNAMPWIEVAKDKRSFVMASGMQPFVPWGFNYDHDTEGRLLEDYWETEWSAVESDFREMKMLGANVARIHLQVAKFMTGSEQPNEKSLAQLAKLVALAEREKLYLDLTGLGCYHKQDVPGWYDKLSEAERWQTQAVFWRAVAKQCANSPAIFCYDLMNEPVVPGGRRKDGDWLGPPFAGKHFVQVITLDQRERPRPEIAKQWIHTLVTAIREVDRRHLVTVGLVDWSLDRPGLTSGLVPDKISEELDFLCIHSYPENGKLDEQLATLKGFAAVGKPVVIEETFPLKCSPAQMTEFLERSREHACGWISFYWGKPIEELRKSSSIGDAILAQWLEQFQKLSPVMRSPR